MPNYRRHYVPGHPVFVTLVTYRRRPWLADSVCAGLLLDAMRRTRGLHALRHLGHAVMPDHMHWLFTPRDGDFSRVVATMKRDATWRLRESRRASPPLWQTRFHDHLIRDEEDLRRHLDYIHFNPVKHGLSASPAVYPFTSFKAWCERGAYEPDWGSQEPRSIAGLDLD